ncbi:hypothetical protein [Aquabacterium sp.]|uniref:hypothetical protein n=1 Tax=Aquabacterium sp. TaxID=1872578 RepID=UPI002486E846|nr:hypothetical protein [Aquabacterium sp.]MDI1259660.1 hypothetical protein [Aquabacterium sp.]
MDSLATLQSMGLTLPTPPYIVGLILFGIVGMWAYWRGKKAQHPHTKWLGVALMFYPYAVSSTWLLYGVGLALCVGLWLEVGK